MSESKLQVAELKWEHHEIVADLLDSQRVLLGAKFAVIRDAHTTKTEGGIYLPDTVQNKRENQSGIVIALGNDIPGEYATVLLGDRVIFSYYNQDGFNLTYGGTTDTYEVTVIAASQVTWHDKRNRSEVWAALNKRWVDMCTPEKVALS